MSSLSPEKDYVSPGLKVVTPDACFPHMRVGDRWSHPWKYMRHEIPHLWYADERHPLMGFLNRDEAAILHNVALQFEGKPALEIGSWLGWSTCHLALAGVSLDVIDPAHDDPAFRADVEESLARCGIADRVRLNGGRSPDRVSELAAKLDRRWNFFFIDGDHEGPAPLIDTRACLPYAAKDCAFVFHDLASPDVAAGLRFLAENGFHVLVYQTAQIMGIAWRGDVTPLRHVPDPDVAWQLPQHLIGLPVSGFEAEELSPKRIAARELREIEYPEGEHARPSVCIVSNEIIGPFKNGGIGTAMTGLAELLASEGLRVTFLYTGGVWAPDIGLHRWRKHYASLGIDLVAFSLNDMASLEGPLKDRGFGVPYLVYRYLSTHPFDVIHFNDCCGEGSLCLAAKELGLAFGQTLLVVALHSPSQWVLELNQTLPTSLLLAAYNYAERLSVRCADVVWSPSRYLLEWARDRDFEFPAQTFLQQYSMPTQRASFPNVDYGRTAKPKELVFFGRLEERKGLRLFCNAIHLLRDELARREIKVTFLGKAETCGGMNSLDYIAHRSEAWRFRVKTITSFGQPEALQYLNGGEKLAVMPSPFDNSPCTVYEALCWGIPFLAARTGGIPELVSEDDRDRVLFDHATEALRDALLDAIDQGGWIARPALAQEEIRRSWSEIHANWRTFLTTRAWPHGARLRPVTAIVDHRSGLNLDATLQSLAACEEVRRVVILNGTAERYGGEACNIDLLTEDPDALSEEIARMAGDAVLLIHSGVGVIADAFRAMLEALEIEGIDGLVPAARVSGVVPAKFVPPLGGSAAFSLFEGVTFTGGLLVRSETLFRAKEGRALAVESPFMGLADFCVTRSKALWPYPIAVLERDAETRIEARSPLPARVASYDESSSIERYYMLATGYGAANGERPVAHKREVALALVTHGLGGLARVASWGLRRARGVRSLLRKSPIGSVWRWMRWQSSR